MIGIPFQFPLLCIRTKQTANPAANIIAWVYWNIVIFNILPYLILSPFKYRTEQHLSVFSHPFLVKISCLSVFAGKFDRNILASYEGFLFSYTNGDEPFSAFLLQLFAAETCSSTWQYSFSFYEFQESMFWMYKCHFLVVFSNKIHVFRRIICCNVIVCAVIDTSLMKQVKQHL